jgi:hypothetical protein
MSTDLCIWQSPRVRRTWEGWGRTDTRRRKLVWRSLGLSHVSVKRSSAGTRAEAHLAHGFYLSNDERFC